MPQTRNDLASGNNGIVFLDRDILMCSSLQKSHTETIIKNRNNNSKE